MQPLNRILSGSNTVPRRAILLHLGWERMPWSGKGVLLEVLGWDTWWAEALKPDQQQVCLSFKLSGKQRVRRIPRTSFVKDRTVRSETCLQSFNSFQHEMSQTPKQSALSWFLRGAWSLAVPVLSGHRGKERLRRCGSLAWSWWRKHEANCRCAGETAET